MAPSKEELNFARRPASETHREGSPEIGHNLGFPEIRGTVSVVLSGIYGVI